MTKDPYIQISAYITPEQERALNLIANKRIGKAEHVRRALDVYLSTQAVREEMDEARLRAGTNNL